MLEKMGKFFDKRLDEYETHQLSCIDSAPAFYCFTAEQLPKTPNCSVLDLGCGTGLELDFYYSLNQTAQITGIDLAPGMLNRLREKHMSHNPTLILGSYFEVPFGSEIYDAAVSVESLHHFSASEKLPLYQKLRAALKPDGFFILTDYFATTDKEEAQFRTELLEAKARQGVADDVLCHYDTPLTVAHERQTLLDAGFSSVEVLKSWGATSVLRVKR